MMLSTRPLRRLRPMTETLEGRQLLNAGGLDTSFGGTGLVSTSFSTEANPSGLAVQSNLDTIVAGLKFSSFGGSGQYDNATIVRYNVNGTLDTSFGTGGTVVLPTYSVHSVGVNPSHDVSLAIQPDGKIVVATNVATYKFTPATKTTAATYTTTGVSMLVARLNSNGSLDTSFGTNGETVISIPNAFEVSSAVTVLSSGQIVVAGYNWGVNAGPEFTVARLTSSGTLDTTFGPNGQGYNGLPYVQSTTESDGVASLAIDSTGNILVGGYIHLSSSNPYQVVRYTSNGLIDTSFANHGIFDLSKVNAFYGVSSIGFQSNGQIILGLPLWQPAQPAVVRLNTNGTIDTTFGTNGFYLEATSSIFGDMTVQPNDKIVFDVGLAAGGQFEIDRLLPGGTLDSSFGTAGKVLVTVPNQSQQIFEPVGLVIGPDGKITGTNVGNATFNTFRLLNDITSNVSSGLASPAAVSNNANSTILMSALTPDLVDLALSGKKDD